MGAFSYFEPVDPDREFEEFLQEPVTADSLAILRHDTADGEYITPKPNVVGVTRARRRRTPRKLSTKQFLDSLVAKS